jgi:cysteine synthase
MAAALRFGRREFEGKTIVVILPDSGRHWSDRCFEGLYG